MTDIVERLRGPWQSPLTREAADEIERLRAKIEERYAFERHQAESWQAELDDAAVENAKLRAMIEQLNGPFDYS